MKIILGLGMGIIWTYVSHKNSTSIEQFVMSDRNLAYLT